MGRLLAAASLFSFKDHLKHLRAHGDPLEVADAKVDFECFRQWVDEAPGYSCAIKSGRQKFNAMYVFNAFILQAQHHLFDARVMQ